MPHLLKGLWTILHLFGSSCCVTLKYSLLLTKYTQSFPNCSSEVFLLPDLLPVCSFVSVIPKLHSPELNCVCEFWLMQDGEEQRLLWTLPLDFSVVAPKVWGGGCFVLFFACLFCSCITTSVCVRPEFLSAPTATHVGLPPPQTLAFDLPYPKARPPPMLEFTSLLSTHRSRSPWNFIPSSERLFIYLFTRFLYCPSHFHASGQFTGRTVKWYKGYS